MQNDNGIFSGGGTTSTFNNAGTFRRTTGTGVADFNAINVNNTGTVEVLSGSLSVSGGGSYNQTAGVTRLNGGNVQDGTLSINGGSLQGTGTISNDVLVSNGGACAPGLSAGKFTIASDYTQTPTGVYNVEIGGLTAGTQFDQVATGSTATVGGTLDVSLIDGFVPSVGNSFIIVDAGFSRSGN